MQTCVKNLKNSRFLNFKLFFTPLAPVRISTELLHPALHTYNSAWLHKQGYTLELYSMTEVQQFSTAIFEAPDDDQGDTR
jgi:hypothetical protein